MERTFENPVTRERATLVESSRESGGKRTVLDFEVAPGGGVMGHAHDAHQERIEVLQGVIEATLDGVTRQVRAGEHLIFEPGHVHFWRNPSATEVLRWRGTFTPGFPGFEAALRVLFGLARDGNTRANGMPRRLDDLALLVKWNQGLPAGPARLLAPILRWLARRAEARGRAAELLRRYGADEPGVLETAPGAHGPLAARRA